MSKPKRDESIELDPPEVEALKKRAKEEGGIAVDLREVVKDFERHGIPPLSLTMLGTLLSHSRKLRMLKDDEIAPSTLAYKMGLKFVLDTQMLHVTKVMNTMMDDYREDAKKGEDDNSGDAEPQIN